MRVRFAKVATVALFALGVVACSQDKKEYVQQIPACSTGYATGACDSGQTCLEGSCVATSAICSTSNTSGSCPSGFACYAGGCLPAAAVPDACTPAARETCRMTPVRMPLMALGRTTTRMVCQRVAPTFQQASRKDRGTAANASLVLAMITGSVITASVSEAARIDWPRPAASTKAPRPNSAWTMLGTPARLMTATWMRRVNQVSRAYSWR